MFGADPPAMLDSVTSLATRVIWGKNDRLIGPAICNSRPVFARTYSTIRAFRNTGTSTGAATAATRIATTVTASPISSFRNAGPSPGEFGRYPCGQFIRIGSLPSQFRAASRTWSKMRMRVGVASAISMTVPGWPSSRK